MLPAGRDATLDGVDEIEVAPFAETRLWVRRQIGRIENADRGLERRAAGRNLGVGCIGIAGPMAGAAAAGIVEPFAIGQICRVLGDCRSVKRPGRAGDPENGKAQRREERQAPDDAFAVEPQRLLLLRPAELVVAALAGAAHLLEGGLETREVGGGGNGPHACL
jgi:hypothetical protein